MTADPMQRARALMRVFVAQWERRREVLNVRPDVKETFLNDYADQFASLPPAQAGEWRWVPVEPTEAMISAWGRSSLGNAYTDDQIAGMSDDEAEAEASRLDWSAMLSAIPDAAPGSAVGISQTNCVRCGALRRDDDSGLCLSGHKMPAARSAPTAERLRSAAKEIVAAQTMRGGFYTGWNITSLNKAVEQLRSALGMEATPLSPETRRMMEHASKTRDAIRAALSDAGEERA